MVAGVVVTALFVVVTTFVWTAAPNNANAMQLQLPNEPPQRADEATGSSAEDAFRVAMQPPQPPRQRNTTVAPTPQDVDAHDRRLDPQPHRPAFLKNITVSDCGDTLFIVLGANKHAAARTFPALSSYLRDTCALLVLELEYQTVETTRSLGANPYVGVLALPGVPPPSLKLSPRGAWKVLRLMQYLAVPGGPDAGGGGGGPPRLVLPPARWYAVIDDDAYVVKRNLMHELRRIPPSVAKGPVMAGRFMHQTRGGWQPTSFDAVGWRTLGRAALHERLNEARRLLRGLKGGSTNRQTAARALGRTLVPTVSTQEMLGASLGRKAPRAQYAGQPPTNGTCFHIHGGSGMYMNGQAFAILAKYAAQCEAAQFGGGWLTPRCEMSEHTGGDIRLSSCALALQNASLFGPGAHVTLYDLKAMWPFPYASACEEPLMRGLPISTFHNVRASGQFLLLDAMEASAFPLQDHTPDAASTGSSSPLEAPILHYDQICPYGANISSAAQRAVKARWRYRDAIDSGTVGSGAQRGFAYYHKLLKP